MKIESIRYLVFEGKQDLEKLFKHKCHIKFLSDRNFYTIKFIRKS